MEVKKRNPRLSPYQIRPALPSDLQTCISLCLELHNENGPEFPTVSPVKLTNALMEALNESRVVLLENNGIAVGILGIYAGEAAWWSDEHLLGDLIFFVKKDFRSNTVFNQLLSVLEEFGKINKLPVQLMFWTTHDIERKFKLLTRKGYKPVGFWVSKRVV